MQLVYLSLLTFALLGSTRYISSDFNETKAEFDQWIIQNAKTYPDNTEYLHRLAIFLENKGRVQKLNLESSLIGGATFAINKFADLTPEEFRRGYLGSVVPPNGTRPRGTLNLKVGNAPPVWDWRHKVTAVKDQGGCGSCWAFSATENIESVWMIAKGLHRNDFQPLSPQQIVDCDSSDSGCNGGWPSNAFQYVIGAGGQESVNSYPYKGRNGQCRFDQGSVEATISSWQSATTTQNEHEMKEAVHSVAPLSVCVDADPWQFYSSGVMKKNQCANSVDHCVQITGYNTRANVPYWEVRNSWGTDWGEKGFILIEFGRNTCAIANYATTAVV